MKDGSKHLEILSIDPERPQANLIALAAEALRTGKTLVFPTDTVYGIGLLVQETANLDSIYRLKQRDQDKAVPLLIEDIGSLEYYSQDLPPHAQKLAQEYWPGPLTLVVKASTALPKQFLAADGTVALRVPDSRIALALIGASGAPIATSSANLQGQPPASSVDQLKLPLDYADILIVDGGPVPDAQPSTIVDCLGAKPKILRAGSIKLR